MTADDFGVGFEALLRVGSEVFVEVGVGFEALSRVGVEVFVEVGVGVRSARSSYKQYNVRGKRKI